jgi:hypothetical protein
MPQQKAIIHIAPDIGYLFPETAGSACVRCGRLAREVFESGEFIGVSGNLNPECEVCPLCAEITALVQRLKAGGA